MIRTADLDPPVAHVLPDRLEEAGFVAASFALGTGLGWRIT